MSKGIGELQRRILWLVVWDHTDDAGNDVAWDAEELKDYFEIIPGCHGYEVRAIRRAARGLAKRGYLLEMGGPYNGPPDHYCWLPADMGEYVNARMTGEDVWGDAWENPRGGKIPR